MFAMMMVMIDLLMMVKLMAMPLVAVIEVAVN